MVGNLSENLRKAMDLLIKIHVYTFNQNFAYNFKEFIDFLKIVYGFLIPLNL